MTPLSMKQFPSFVDQELNLPAPGAIDHIDDDEDDNDDSNRYELWTFRIPSGMNVSDLNGVELDLDVIGKSNTKSSSKNTKGFGMKINDGKFSVSRGDSVENQNFRVLVPNQHTDDDDSRSSSSDNSDGDGNKFLLRPSRRPFTKHLNVHSTALLRKSEAELAPLVGPEPTGDDVLRHAYSHVPQKTGLKRRWMPLGAPQSVKDIPSALVTLREEGKHGNVDANVNAAAAISSDDDAKDKKRRKSSGGKRRQSKQCNEDANAAGEDEHIATPKKKRVKKEKGRKSAEKSAKKSANKQRKQSKKKEQDDISV